MFESMTCMKVRHMKVDFMVPGEQVLKENSGMGDSHKEIQN